MRICTNAFHVPKHGNAEGEYEDAFFPENGKRQASEFRCAVADGASESAFAQQWARLLVRGFGRRRLRLTKLRRLWQRAINGQPLPWYLESKILKGAYAAFVGLSIRDGGAATGNGDGDAACPPIGPWVLPDDTETGGGGAEAPDPKAKGSWRALAVGDSCLFHVRGDELLAFGPVERADQFDNSPHLISSRSPQPLRRGDEHLTVLSGAWRPGDTFLLATDAIAKYLMAEQEEGRPPWTTVRDLDGSNGSTSFARLVELLRSERVLHNDDTTLLRVEVA
jgi:hypothetical protein